MGWVIREWREEFRLGIIRECSPWSRVVGLSRSPLRVRGRGEKVSLSEGPMLNNCWLGLGKRLERLNGSPGSRKIVPNPVFQLKV